MSRSEVIDLGAKLLLPLALGALAYVEHRGATKISEAQLNLARQGEERQREQAKTDADLKYLELFLQDIRSGDPNKQKAALSILNFIRPDLGLTLAAWAENYVVSQSLKAEARQAGKSIAETAELRGFKIGIYFNRSRPDLKRVANEIRQGLRDKSLTNVQLYEKDDDFFTANTPPRGYEIRYDPGEENAAAALKAILEQVSPDTKFVPVQLGKSTPRFISVFIGPV